MQDPTPADVVTLVGRHEDIEIAGQQVRIIRLKARPYIEALAELAQAQARIAISGEPDVAGITRIAMEVPGLVAQAVRRLQDGEWKPVTADWVVDLDPGELIDLIDVTLTVNDLETVTKKALVLSQRVAAALAGPK